MRLPSRTGSTQDRPAVSNVVNFKVNIVLLGLAPPGVTASKWVVSVGREEKARGGEEQ